MMEITYANPWYKDAKGYGPEKYQPERFVTHQNGFDIYYRAGCFDIVKSGVCLTQMAGINGAKYWCRQQ